MKNVALYACIAHHQMGISSNFQKLLILQGIYVVYVCGKINKPIVSWFTHLPFLSNTLIAW